MTVTATGELERKINIVRSWAERRALHTSQPGDFMDHFEHEMERLLLGASPDRQVRDLSDPLSLAAQIEAASAARAIEWWGTGSGLIPKCRKSETRR
jgi:hypothetical protein